MKLILQSIWGVLHGLRAQFLVERNKQQGGQVRNELYGEVPEVDAAIIHALSRASNNDDTARRGTRSS